MTTTEMTMPRLIDGDALMTELSTMYKEPTSTEDFMAIGYDKAIADVVVTAHRQPTVDAVEVVRCKDCKYRDDYDFCTGRGYPNALVPDDGFCDKGKRRD